MPFSSGLRAFRPPRHRGQSANGPASPASLSHAPSGRWSTRYLTERKWKHAQMYILLSCLNTTFIHFLGFYRVVFLLRYLWNDMCSGEESKLPNACSFPEWKSLRRLSRPFSISCTSETSVRKECWIVGAAWPWVWLALAPKPRRCLDLSLTPLEKDKQHTTLRKEWLHFLVTR